jgi:hypothetical protein
MIHPGWFVISAIGFLVGSVWLLVSAWVGWQLLSQLLPMLTETRGQVQDLGDLAANTVGRASDTLDVVERRVSETMGQANLGGVAAGRQALGVGTAIAGIYMVSRMVTLLRGNPKQAQHKQQRGRWYRRRHRR